MEDLIDLAIRKLAETQLPNREIYLLTDKQNQSYPVKPELPIHLIPLPEPESYANLACSDAKPIPQLVQKSRSQMIEFKLSNYGDQERKEVLVKAVVNDIKLAEKFISIPARQTLTESILIELQQDGWQKGYIEVMDDRLSLITGLLRLPVLSLSPDCSNLRELLLASCFGFCDQRLQRDRHAYNDASFVCKQCSSGYLQSDHRATS
jgi:hypothetical protein